jgi:hypothetical protein
VRENFKMLQALMNDVNPLSCDTWKLRDSMPQLQLQPSGERGIGSPFAFSAPSLALYELCAEHFSRMMRSRSLVRPGFGMERGLRQNFGSVKGLAGGTIYASVFLLERELVAKVGHVGEGGSVKVRVEDQVRDGCIPSINQHILFDYLASGDFFRAGYAVRRHAYGIEIVSHFLVSGSESALAHIASPDPALVPFQLETFSLTLRNAETCNCGAGHREMMSPVSSDAAEAVLATLRGGRPAGLAPAPVMGTSCFSRMLPFAQVVECFVHLTKEWVSENVREDWVLPGVGAGAGSGRAASGAGAGAGAGASALRRSPWES